MKERGQVDLFTLLTILFETGKQQIINNYSIIMNNDECLGTASFMEIDDEINQPGPFLSAPVKASFMPIKVVGYVKRRRRCVAA
jgi:hypothetical protein